MSYTWLAQSFCYLENYTNIVHYRHLYKVDLRRIVVLSYQVQISDQIRVDDVKSPGQFLHS